MKSMMPGDFNVEMMPLSVREIRMVVERILLSVRIPDGFVPAVRDCVLYSQAMGLGGLAMLKRDYDHLKNAKPASMRLISAADCSGILDAANQHAWIVAPSLIDLAIADARLGGNGEARVRNVVEVAELALLGGYAGRFGVRVDMTTRDKDALLRVTADGLGGHDQVLQGALANGMPVPKLLWEELYARSHDALTPDSIESRRHAGPVMVDAEGRVHGRDDDDTDFTLLGVNPASPARENT